MSALAELQIVHEHYEGPLDILLKMLEQRELDITGVSLSLITGDFLSYVDEVKEHNPSLLGEFLGVASRLLHLKSTLILPGRTEVADDSDEEPLEEQLKRYRAVKEAAKLLGSLQGQGEMFSRTTENKPIVATFTPITQSEFDQLGKIFTRIIGEQSLLPSPPEEHIEAEVSLEEKIELIQELAKANRSLDLIATLRHSRTHTEVVVSFLAILELLKQRVIRFDGVMLWRVEA